jgi:hypothetical protein
MIRILVAAILLITFSCNAGAESLTLSPKYDAVGLNPDGSKYKGVVVLEKLSDTTFAIQWSIGGAVYKGFGMRRNDELAATYTIDGEPGLVIYHVDGDGLDGIWAIRGENGNGAEHLTPTK